MAPNFKPRRTRRTAVLQSQRERINSFRIAVITRSRAEGIFRQTVARGASTVSRNDGDDVRNSRAGHIKLGISRVAARHLALDYRRADCVCVADGLFFSHIIPQRAQNSLVRTVLFCEKLIHD
jgi:hypothetical protein